LVERGLVAFEAKGLPTGIVFKDPGLYKRAELLSLVNSEEPLVFTLRGLKE
jgi:hypothetical protein